MGKTGENWENGMAEAMTFRLRPTAPSLPAKSHEGLFQIEYKGWADYFLVALCPLNFSRNLSYI